MVSEYLFPVLGIAGALLLYVFVTRGTTATLKTGIALVVAGILVYVVYLGLN